MDRKAGSLGDRVGALLALLGLVPALLLSWAHPVEIHGHANHECAGAAHVAPASDGSDHDEAGCALCDLAHGAGLAPDLSGPSLLAPAPRGTIARVALAAERGPPLLGFDSRGPPA